MAHLIGTFDCKIDDKGRLVLPSGLKKQFVDFENLELVAKRALFQPCLELYPMDQWQAIMAQVANLNPFVKKNNDFVRRFTAGLKIVEIDSSSRIQISKELIAFAGLKKEVVLNASFHKIELWNKSAYEAAVDNQAIDFAALAEEVMGNSSAYVP